MAAATAAASANNNGISSKHGIGNGEIMASA